MWGERERAREREENRRLPVGTRAAHAVASWSLRQGRRFVRSRKLLERSEKTSRIAKCSKRLGKEVIASCFLFFFSFFSFIFSFFSFSFFSTHCKAAFPRLHYQPSNPPGIERLGFPCHPTINLGRKEGGWVFAVRVCACRSPF